MEYVSSVNYTLFINGTISQSFKTSRGLRPGDLLSPYLFLMCANILSLALLKAEHNHDIMGVKLGRNGFSFTYLFFADDSLLFFRNDAKSLATLRTILEWYCILSG